MENVLLYLVPFPALSFKKQTDPAKMAERLIWITVAE